MADFFGAGESLLGGVSSFISGNAAAKGASSAAQSYGQAAALTKASTMIKQSMIGRQVYQALGGMKAAAGSSGLTTGGSVQDLIRDSAHQGAITKAVVGLQGEIDYNSLTAQQQASQAQASASKSGGTMGLIGGILGGVGKMLMFSDDALKEDVEFVRRRSDGIGIYRFKYLGSHQVFEGVMASDVEKVRPDAIYYDEGVGFRMVDYDRIGAQLKQV